MNLLQLEDVVKGLPDDQLFQEAQSPSGELPQFLTISEIRRRSDMRERFKAQEQQPQNTIADQVLQQGVASMQGQGQMGMQGYAGGGQVQPRWWERMLPMAHPNMMVRDMQPPQEPNMQDQLGGSSSIRMQIADIQSQGMTPDLDENGQPLVSWENGEPKVIVNGEPYGYSGGGIVSFQGGGQARGSRWWERMMPMANPSIAAQDMGSMSQQDMMRLLFGEGYAAPDAGGPEVNQGIVSIPQEEFVGTMEPELQPNGGVNIQGESPIQEQSMGLGALLASPAMPQDERFEYPSDEPRRQGYAKLGSERRAMYEDMAEEQRNSNIEVDDLIEGGKKDAWASAMVQIGAGIARNDLAGGLEQAGQTGADAAKQARAMELWSRIQRAENDAKARELLAEGVISEQEYEKAILDSEAAENLGRTEFDFKQREADREALYKRGQARLNELRARLAGMEILEKLTAQAARGEETPEPPEGRTLRELMKTATGLGPTFEAAIGRLIDLGGPMPEGAKEIVDARADITAHIQTLYRALSSTRSYKEIEWLEKNFDIRPRLMLGDDTAVKNLDGLASALSTMQRQHEADAQNPSIPTEERKAAEHAARVIRNFITVIGPPESTAEDFLNQ